jgi:hypothetical protein
MKLIGNKIVLNNDFNLPKVIWKLPSLLFSLIAITEND